ncbi:MAG: alcohol dehydrogenase catalytic domain-containing protein, partial [Armatimonadota bacterium]|nr:alcohol dehydrogenase catalytic domain-containing protein [Armatimonadota bacterium]
MLAAVLYRFGRPLRLEDRPRPRTRGEQVLVRVRGAGVCHSDVHMADGEFAGVRLPLVPGHEVAGDVPGMGPVLVYASWGCGRCQWCRQGDEQLCPDGLDAGWTADGGYAEWMVVPSRRYLIPLGDLDPVRAAPLADAGVTP